MVSNKSSKEQSLQYLEGRMNIRTIPWQKSKAAIFNQITGIIIYRFRHKCFKNFLHFLPSQSIHPAYLILKRSNNNFFISLIAFIQELTTKGLFFFCSWRKVRGIRQSNKNSLLLIILYRNHYKIFKIIIISHNLLLTSGYICCTFYTFGD